MDRRFRRWGSMVTAVALLAGGVVAAVTSTPAAAGPPPAPIVDQVTAGAYHSCAHRQGGTVKCWGLNTQGPTATGDPESRGDEPGEMGTELPVVDVGAGRTIDLVAWSTASAASIASAAAVAATS